MHRKAWMWSHGEGQLLRGAPVTRVGAVSRASWACNRWRLVLHVMHAGSRLGQTRGLYRTRRAVFHPGEGGECSPADMKKACGWSSRHDVRFRFEGRLLSTEGTLSDHGVCDGALIHFGDSDGDDDGPGFCDSDSD